MKKIIFIVVIVFLVFLIYILNKDKKIYYLSLGDELLLNGFYNEKMHKLLGKKDEKYTMFNEKNMRTIDLINMIKDNALDSNNIHIQNALIKADIVVMSVGSSDIMPKFGFNNLYSDAEIYDYIDNYLNDLEELIILIRKYCKEKIVFIGYYNIINNDELDKYYEYLIKRCKYIMNKYNIIYLDVYDKFNDIFYRNKTMYPNLDGYKYIVDEIKKLYKNDK